MLKKLQKWLAEQPIKLTEGHYPMTDHPYKSLPNKAFWRRTVAQPASNDVDPVGEFELHLTPKTKVATAGSCFAQHFARHLANAGFYYYNAEPGHPILSSAARKASGYNTYSARYGNIYTARQLFQLIERAYGRFTPQEAPWIEDDGQVLDPFRPTVQPGGFISAVEMEQDRAQHLSAVRDMFENLDVFVFTLGLTECWESRADGAVFPLCPGVDGGQFNSDKYAFRNQDVTEVLSDMNSFLVALREVNPTAEVLLTVSPVPLMATAEPNANVLSATVYSKSVLRVAAETLRKAHKHVHYFPSFEVITGSFNRGAYFAEDLRNATENGVQHAMRLVLQHATNSASIAPKPDKQDDETDSLKISRDFVELECDEVALDQS